MPRTSLIVVVSAVILLLFVLELVRSRRLREEYAWLWLLTAIFYLLVALKSNVVAWVVGFLDVRDGASAFAFLGLYFLVLISIQYSIRLSRLTTRVKDLAQHIAILDSELQRLSETTGINGATGQPAELGQLKDRNESVAQQLVLLSNELQRLTQAHKRPEMAAQPSEEQTSAECAHH